MVKQQHYVPRCYLWNFANPKGQIWVYDKSLNKTFLSKIEGVAGEKFFYDTNGFGEAGHQQFIEKALGVLEGEAAEVFRELRKKLDSNCFTRLNANERYFLALFIAVQMLRTREQRIQIEEMANQYSAWLNSYLTEEMKAAHPDQIPPLKISENQLAGMQGMFLSNPEVLTKYAEILDSHFWIILQTVPGQSFITSDHPVGKRANIHLPLRSLTGIASKGIEIVFPFSPSYCLCLYERTHFANKLEKFRSVEGGVCQLNDSANMDYCNYFQITQSTRFVFDNGREFTFSKKVCTEEPQWRDQSRTRFVTNRK